jgi:hypothetical protein
MLEDKDLIKLYDEYSKCKTVRGRTETRVKIKNRLNFLKINEDKKMVDVGDTVEFKGQDSYYKGVVVCIFKKLNGAVRCVVEDDRGLLLIKDPSKAKVIV